MQLIKYIKASNILSFGPDGLDLPLGSLNVLIGPNGSGKSNLLELFALLRSTPRSTEETTNNLQGVVRRGGGVLEWIWKGDSDAKATIETILPNLGGQQPLRHKLVFYADAQRFRVYDEVIESESPYGYHSEPFFFYKYQRGHPIVKNIGKKDDERQLTPETVTSELSILAQRRDPDEYPVLLSVANSYEKIRLYREWDFGRSTIFREPQKADLRNDRLEEDFSNLGLFLNQLGKSPRAKRSLTIALRDLYEGLEGYEVIIEGGTVQVFFSESNFTIPATRLSDGSLRYLCLLAILLDPTPPPFICIEEPELGMHPDMLPKIADLLITASERTQIIVTTHSDILVDALSEQPECVLICEKHQGQTLIKRLEKEELKPWLEQYRLGQLWSMGELGGNRW